MKILIVGDIHGRFGDFNKLINNKKPDVVIQAGDNAYYWINDDNIGKIKPQGSKVYLVPGNHESWDMIHKKIGRNKLEPTEIEKDLFYCSIGSSIKINDKRILFVGGADSIDKEMRTIKYNWFPEEILNNNDVNFILNNYNKIDMVVSHTCPTEFNMNKTKRFDKYNDPSRIALSVLLEKYSPMLWYFGHWHHYIQGKYEKTLWTGLNMARDFNWWREIEI